MSQVSVTNVSVFVSGVVSTGRDASKPDLNPLSKILKLEGKRVHVEPAPHLSQNMKHIEGQISKGRIQLPGLFKGSKTVGDFAKLAGHGPADAWHAVYVQDVPNSRNLFPNHPRPAYSLRELWEKYLEQGGSYQDALKGELDALRVGNYGDAVVWNVQVLSKGRSATTAYRVCRRDETICDGIKFAPTVKSGEYKENFGALQFFAALNAHVGHGTRMTTQKAFISATTSAQVALWWSGFGLLKIAQIDLNKVEDAGLAQWHVGGDHAELLFPMQRNFALSSQEVCLPRVALAPLSCKPRAPPSPRATACDSLLFVGRLLVGAPASGGRGVSDHVDGCVMPVRLQVRSRHLPTREGPLTRKL